MRVSCFLILVTLICFMAPHVQAQGPPNQSPKTGTGTNLSLYQDKDLRLMRECEAVLALLEVAEQVHRLEKYGHLRPGLQPADSAYAEALTWYRLLISEAKTRIEAGTYSEKWQLPDALFERFSEFAARKRRIGEAIQFGLDKQSYSESALSIHAEDCACGKCHKD